MAGVDTLNCQRVYKKSSPNNKLTLYLCSRDLVIENGAIDKLQGVLCVDPDILDSKKVFGQVTLTFRYGREDEEVMGLKFCNEAVMCLAQIHPPMSSSIRGEPITPLQEALLQRLGPRAHAFTMELTPLAPPSVQLVPAKEYRGAPIGTSYDVRAYVAETTDAKLEKRTTVRMGIRVVQGGSAPGLPSDVAATSLSSHPARESRLLRLSPKNFKGSASPGRRPSTQLRPPVLPEESALGEDGQQETCFSETEHEGSQKSVNTIPPPHATVEKPFLLSEGRVSLEASLDKGTYFHGEPIEVTVNVANSSHKTVRRIKVFVVQHVDVCMFSNGKFKNIVALTTSKDECPVSPGGSMTTCYTLRPARGTTKNWIALEDSYSKSGASLASTVICSTNNIDDRNVFAIYVSYYVKVKLGLSAMGGELSLKLPFTLQHSSREEEPLSLNANVIHSELITDDVITECPVTIVDKANNISRDAILGYREQTSPKTEPDELQIGLITPDDGSVVGGKIIVSVEDHPPPTAESHRRKLERNISQEKCDVSAKKTHNNEDMNLITNYDSDNT